MTKNRPKIWVSILKMDQMGLSKVEMEQMGSNRLIMAKNGPKWF